MRGMLGSASVEEVPFDWKSINYAPIVMAVLLIALWLGWHLSAKKWFTGPRRTIDDVMDEGPIDHRELDPA